MSARAHNSSITVVVMRCIKLTAGPEGRGLLVAPCDLLRSSAAPVQLATCPQVRFLALLDCASFLSQEPADLVVAEVAAEQRASISVAVREAVGFARRQAGPKSRSAFAAGNKQARVRAAEASPEIWQKEGMVRAAQAGERNVRVGMNGNIR